MDAITVSADHTVRLGSRSEPEISGPRDVKLRVVRVGICGTDREEVSSAPISTPANQPDLVIGHEMIGRVLDVGDDVHHVKPGDYAVLTVRRGCGHCLPCNMGRADMCRTGEYRERGIRGLDGYQTEFVVDKAEHVVHVPAVLAAAGVLSEPLSIVEKAIHELVQLQAVRLPDASATPSWLAGRHCLIAGIGPVGLLAALALRLRDAEVYGLDIVDEQSARPGWLREIGGKYIDGRSVQPDHIEEVIGEMDVVLEATGAPRLAFGLIDALGYNGAYVLTGLPEGHGTFELPAADLMRQMVLDNQLLLGSVNAAYDHFRMAVHDLTDACRRWPGALDRLITHRYRVSDFEKPLHGHTPDEIKAVIQWSE